MSGRHPRRLGSAAGGARNNPEFRSALYQLALLAVLAVARAIAFVLNARANLQAQGITSGFGFLGNTAGFGVNQSLIAYNESDTYGRVFLVGSSIRSWSRTAESCLRRSSASRSVSPGFRPTGWLRGSPADMSSSSAICRCCFRSCSGTSPCSARCRAAPEHLAWVEHLSQQPRSHPAGAGHRRGSGILSSVALIYRQSCGRRPGAFGQSAAATRPARAVSGAGGPAVAARHRACRWLSSRLTGFPIGLRDAAAARIQLRRRHSPHPRIPGAPPVALTIYTAAFIAEIVRAGMLAVPRGQCEAAFALGLQRGA